MTNVLSYTAKTYFERIDLMLLFSIPFIIAFLIPVFASFPTYSDLGGIFLRTTNIITNLTPISAAIIVAAVIFSLLFLSFALVAINIIVKHSRTYSKIRSEVIKGLEKYTSRVFALLLIYTAILIIINLSLSSYGVNFSGIVTSIVGLALSPFFFYAPASIVIDDNKLSRAIKSSLIFVKKRFDYFILWIIVACALLSVFDVIFIALAGNSSTGVIISTYAMLLFSSLFIMPFLVVLQSECYMKRFRMLRN